MIDNPFEFYRRYSPSMRCSGVKKYIIPIKRQFHEILFPDIQVQRSLFRADNPAGNTIKKAYLSHTQLKDMSPGDIILFYRSGDQKKITTMAIVEDYFSSDSSELIITRVAKRTVYSLEEIEQMTKKMTKVLLFRQVMHFDVNINHAWMKRNGIKGNIQSIRQISDDTFKRIMDAVNAQNCINVD